MDYLAIATIDRNEPDLPEWIEFHLELGVGHIYIFDNDSELSVSHLVGDRATVSVFEWPGRNRQVEAYQYATTAFGHRCRWLAMLDADEYLLPRNGNLPELLRNYERFGGLGINWQSFGPNGHRIRPTGLVIENYTTRLPTLDPVHAHIKSVVNPRLVERWSAVHHPIYLDGAYAVNETQDRIDGPISPPSVETVSIHHYWTKSYEDFARKRARGYPDGASPTSAAAIDTMAASCTVVDASATRLAPAVRQRLAASPPGPFNSVISAAARFRSTLRC